MTSLPIAFYKQKTEIVAKSLLGKRLVHLLPNGTRLSGIIVETEAYLGIKDRACHTYNNKRTSRTEAMYLEGGHSYVYFIYGMYDCFNVVTRASDEPEAVLIRALEPSEGIEQMQKYRQQIKVHNLCSGPGKLCQALKINRQLNAHLLTEQPLWIEDTGLNIRKGQIISKPRVGVQYAGTHAAWPLRFYIKNNPFISKE